MLRACSVHAPCTAHLRLNEPTSLKANLADAAKAGGTGAGEEKEVQEKRVIEAQQHPGLRGPGRQDHYPHPHPNPGPVGPAELPT